MRDLLARLRSRAATATTPLERLLTEAAEEIERSTASRGSFRRLLTNLRRDNEAKGKPRKDQRK